MYEPLLATALEGKASKLLEILHTRQLNGKENIKYLASVMLDIYNKGFDDAVITIGEIQRERN